MRQSPSLGATSQGSELTVFSSKRQASASSRLLHEPDKDANLRRRIANVQAGQSLFNKQLAGFNAAVAAFDERSAAFDRRSAAFDRRSAAMDVKLAAMDVRLAAMDVKLAENAREIAVLEKKLRTGDQLLEALCQTLGLSYTEILSQAQASLSQSPAPSKPLVRATKPQVPSKKSAATLKQHSLTTSPTFLQWCCQLLLKLYRYLQGETQVATSKQSSPSASDVAEHAVVSMAPRAA